MKKGDYKDFNPNFTDEEMLNWAKEHEFESESARAILGTICYDNSVPIFQIIRAAYHKHLSVSVFINLGAIEDGEEGSPIMIKFI